MDGHVGDVRAVEPVSERSAGADQDAAAVDEALEHAAGEHRLERLGRLVCRAAG
jgi:hypothetical protein